MKKHFLFLVALVLGLGQLYADQVAFKASDLATITTEVTLPYTWKTESSSHVSVTLGGTGNLAVASPLNLNNGNSITVSVGGAGTVNVVTLSGSGAGNISANTGTYTPGTNSGTWAPGDATNSVTFTISAAVRLSKITVDYTPDPNYTPVEPATATMGDPIEAIAIDNINTYTGSEPYVYNRANRTYYALNSLGEYEEYGVFTEVNTLAVASAGLTEIEYIASNTTKPYINTGYVHKANTRIVMECNIDGSNTANYQAPFGSRAGYGSNMFVFFWRFSGHNRGCFARNAEVSGEEGMEVPTGEKIKVDANGLTLNVYKDGVTDPSVTITDGGESKGGTTPMYIFDLCHADHPDGSATFMKLYTFKIYEGETLVMDLVPVVNGEGKGGLKDKITGNVFYSASSGSFTLPEGAGSEAGIPVYEGKRVKLTTDNHEYKYQDGEWLDCGAMTLEEITDTDPSYKDMRNWKTNDGHMSIYAGFTYDGTTNVINPYVGTGGYEPYMFQIPTIAGEDYNWSFVYSGSVYDSWHSTPFHAFVTNAYDLGMSTTGDVLGGDVIGIAEAFPFEGAENKPYSIDFTAKQNLETLVIQFGDANDGKEFWFKFANLKVSKYIYPLAYEQIDFVVQDDNKYTPLDYIEAISQARENTYTLPYIPVTATQIDAKFQVYDTSTGWCGIFCARNIYAGTGISLYMNGNDRAHFGYFTGGTTGSGDNFAPFSLNTDYEVSADVTKLVVNGETYTTGNNVTNATSRQLSLFANPEFDYAMRGRFYYCKIAEADETIFDFQPVMRHDGAFGFYDRKTATFVLPAKGTFDGYNYAKLQDKAYVTYNNDTRIVIVGSTAQFLPDVQNLDGATFTWTSSDETKATVAADGTVTGVAAGKVTITATTNADEGWTASYELTVSEPDYKRYDANNVGYAIVTGGNGWGDSPLSALLDNDARTKFGCSGAGDAWAIMIASEPVAVQQYSIVTGGDTYNYPGRNPVSWKLEGSNDNQTWTLIDEKVQTYQLKSFNKYENVFAVNGTETYKFFKFSATQLADAFQVSEFWINEQTHNFNGEGTVLYEPTCTTDGKVGYACTDCGALNHQSIPALGHDFGTDGVCSRCNKKVSESIILANGQANPYFAKFRHASGVSDAEFVDIEQGWNEAGFDDSEWDDLLMPLGTNGYGVQHTIWVNDYNTFWFRRNFYVENPAEFTKVTLKTLHDDDYAVFVNGTLIHTATGWTNGTDWVVLDVDPSLLVQGNNVVAMYIEQNWGGAYCDFSLEAELGATVEVGESKYATFVAPFDVDFTGSDAIANAATFDGKYVQLVPVTTVPAGTAVVIKAEEGTYTVPKTINAVLGEPNELIASNGVVADGTQYVLANDVAGVGFYQVVTGSTITAGKGYLVITGNDVKAFYGFDPEDATGIDGVEIAGENAPIYNVAGQRMSKMQKGINIVGSKKVLK